jgi:FkbM family methyltransferase
MKKRPIDIISDFLGEVSSALSDTPISRIPGIKTAYLKLTGLLNQKKYDIEVPEKITYRDSELYVFPEEEFAKRIYVDGKYSNSDEKEWEIFDEYISEGDVVFDVGAFIGTHSLMMRELVGQSGRVYAFEPQPNCAELIHKTFTENGFTNCIIVNKAVGCEVGSFNLQTSEGGDATSNVVGSDPWNQHTEAVKVEMIRLDDYLTDNKIKNIHFMKIDVQGSALDVIKGLGRKLTNVEVIYMEIHSKYINDIEREVRELFDILNNSGDVILADKEEKNVVSSAEELIFEEYHPDIIWVKR